MRAAINILLVVIVGLVVSARGLQSNLDSDSYTYDPDSVAHNERILRLFIQLASETANHLIRLKKTAKPPADVKPKNGTGAATVSPNGSRDAGNLSESIKDSATQVVEIGTRMMIIPEKNDTSQVPARTNTSGTPILPSQRSEPGLARQDAGAARVVDVVVASTGAPILASQSGQSVSSNQSRQSGNVTGRMVNPTDAPGPGINQVAAGQMSSLSTVQPVGLKIQSESKSQTGNGTGEMVHQARGPQFNQGAPGQLSSLSTVQAVKSKIQSNIDSGRDFGRGAGMIRQLSTAGPRIDHKPLGQLSTLPIAQDAGSKNLMNGMIALKAGNPTEQSGNVNIAGLLDPNRLMTFRSTLGSITVPAKSELRRILGPVGIQMNSGPAPASILNSTSVPVNASGDLGRILSPIGALMNPTSALGSILNSNSVPVNPNGDLGRIFGPVGLPMNPGRARGSISNPINVPANPITDLGRIIGPVGIPTNPVISPVNPGASATPNQAISAIVDAGNGTAVGSMQSGQATGTKVMGDFHNKASSLARGSTGQAGQLLSGLTDAGAKSSGQPISEKGNGILSSSSIGLNGRISDLNSKLKEASPLFRSLPDVEATSRGIVHDLELTKKHGQSAHKAPFKSEKAPSLLNDKVELDLQDFAVKFADALRPLDSGSKIPGSPGSKDPMGDGANTQKTMM